MCVHSYAVGCDGRYDVLSAHWSFHVVCTCVSECYIIPEQCSVWAVLRVQTFLGPLRAPPCGCEYSTVSHCHDYRETSASVEDIHQSSTVVDYDLEEEEEE